MLPKIASALARVLDPIKPLARPGQSIGFSKSSESGGGGHGPLGYEAPADGAESENPSSPHPEEANSPDGPVADLPSPAEKRGSSLPLQPGLTQVILELNATRNEKTAGAAAHTYETGAKDQKKNARLPKGSMLDKKVG